MPQSTNPNGTLLPACDWTAEEVASAQYDLGNLQGPELTGRWLTAYRQMSEGSLTSGLIHSTTLRRNGVFKFMSHLLPEAPQASGVPPLPDRPEDGVVQMDRDGAASPAARVMAALDALGWSPDAQIASPRQDSGPVRPGILDYHAAFLSGAVTPSDVADSIVRFLEENSEGKANWFCEFMPDHFRAQAAASSERYAAGAPLSVLDGVPFAVKDSVGAFGHKTGHGTTFLGAMEGAVPSVALEAPAVAALRSLGALMAGKTQMQEFGLLPTGINANQGLARNPHDPEHIAGGSSTGSACVVAAGVCAFAIGTDGGGSVRIPAALCGVVGFKPTQGRMAADPDNSGLVTLGPLATSVADALIVYAAMACPGSCVQPCAASRQQQKEEQPRQPSLMAAEAAEEVEAAAAAAAAEAAAPAPEATEAEDPASRPPLALPARVLPGGAGRLPGGDAGRELLDGQPLSGLRVGVYRPWFDDARPGVAAACRAGLDVMVRLGARVVDIILPELEQLRSAAAVIILTELFGHNRQLWEDPAMRSKMNEDTRIVMSIASQLVGSCYLQGQRVRRRQRHHWCRAFQSCDIIATPATACTAPRFPQGAALTGALHLPTSSQLLRFSVAANLLGLPALALPVGAAEEAGSPGLPASLQLIGRPWHDATVLRVGAVLEAGLEASGVSAPIPPLCSANVMLKGRDT